MGDEQPKSGITFCWSLVTGHCSHGADVAQLVEHVLGKDGVSGSIPLIGSRDLEGPEHLDV